jgi:hypothetical protein
MISSIQSSVYSQKGRYQFLACLAYLNTRMAASGMFSRGADRPQLSRLQPVTWKIDCTSALDPKEPLVVDRFMAACIAAIIRFHRSSKYR